MIKVELERVKGDFGFVARDGAGHKMHLDSSAENGGSDSGIRPMQTLLMALGACSGIDIISILKKQGQHPLLFSITIEGERQQVGSVSLWKRVHVTFRFSGELSADKVKRACGLSIEKYCSVAQTLRLAGADISWTSIIETKN